MRNSFLPILALILALGGGASAQTGIDPKLASLKSQAAKLAAGRNYSKAVDKLTEARAALRTDRRRAVGAVPRSKVNPKYRAAVRQLAARMKTKWQKGPRTAASRQAVTREFNAGKKALEKKYPPLKTGPTAGARAAGAAKVGARYTLVDAGLEELMAGYLDRGGQKTKARGLRETALIHKLEAYRALGKTAEAGQIAQRLLAAKPADPAAYRQVAEFHQERGRYSEAAATWRRGIAHVEAGSADTASRAQTLSYFYRQLAFAYSKAGKAAESRAALQRAQQLER